MAAGTEDGEETEGKAVRAGSEGRACTEVAGEDEEEAGLWGGCKEGG